MLRPRGKLALMHELQGVVTFFGSYHAMRAESVLRKRGWPALLIPGPREISPNCGVALRFDYSQKEEVQELLDRSLVQYESFHHYPHQG